MTEPRHTVLFLHVMKCGGTSFFKLGEATLGPERSRRLVQDEIAQGRLPPDIAHCRFLHGHLSAWHLGHLPMATQIVTLLRRPAARLVSLYHFFRAMELGTAELADPAPYYCIARAAKALDLAGFLRSEEPAVRSQTSEHSGGATARRARPPARRRAARRPARRRDRRPAGCRRRPCGSCSRGNAPPRAGCGSP